MRLSKCLMAGLVVALLFGGGTSHAGTDLNEVGAFLVYPLVAAVPIVGGQIETYMAVVNTGQSSVNAHLAFINGDEDSDEYCFECNYTIPLTPNDTELLVLRQSGLGIQIDTEDGTLQGACPHPFGMITVSLEDASGATITDNVLLGSEVVVNYTAGIAHSLPAIPFQGKNGGNGDRNYGFDDNEYGKLPRVIAADFIAPDLGGPAGIQALLALFTLGFEAEFPPFSHCEIEGYDNAENPFSRSFNFGCWTLRFLEDLHTEFAYGNLGQTACTPGLNCATHGWLKLDCDVTNGASTVPGGVHGAIVQSIVPDGGLLGIIRRNGPGPKVSNAAAWGRALYQSVSTGGSVTYHLSGPGGGLN